ncbi:lactonase family protein [Candidatus Chloroploca sp. Khr17]|uniref:lactonase family protein n=1 Tax=Candidatus Chloroploca sp. Khr17 TaxID=2496869 RepID=UPI00101DD6DE|nr:lactonase family protein [Candidatus Chloroploca sp. Khr17]
MASEHVLLLAGSYAAADQPGIYLFALTSTTGELTPLGACAGVTNPSFLALHPGGDLVLATSETGAGDGNPGGVATLRLDRATQTLAILGWQRSGGDWPCHVTLDPRGAWAVVANYGGGSLGLLSLTAEGVLGPLRDVAQHEGRSVDPERQQHPHPHASIVSADGHFVIATDLGIDQLRIYTLDTTHGCLTPHSHTLARRGAGPRHLCWHPNGRILYVANELDNTIAVYGYDPGKGTLVERQIISTLLGKTSANQVADLHLDKQASRLYVSNRGDNTIAIFGVERDGSLHLATLKPCGGNWPRNFTLSPEGNFLIVANQYSGELVVLPILEHDEALGEPIARAKVPQIACVIVA